MDAERRGSCQECSTNYGTNTVQPLGPRGFFFFYNNNISCGELMIGERGLRLGQKKARPHTVYEMTILSNPFFNLQLYNLVTCW